ncbi:hypothetical protein MSG28_005574 [Choristoneura fumiferana]|uniref:Uncharacterized protein n=1 Tax=Choristoneura fumiferana TaxID=7141 RepID=A0ACC0KZW6_CHOFU|nr:hypothetical protein MSG28_005574 [Choristoneura fumiferana]
MIEPISVLFQVVHEGPVKRTKFFENGKKSRKNWMECYMVLTQTGLYFYKDHRTYTATKIPKPPGTPPSPTAPRPEMMLGLQNAHVVRQIPGVDDQPRPLPAAG